MLVDANSRSLSAAAAHPMLGDYLRAITPLPLAGDGGPCVAAVTHRERIIVSDFASDSYSLGSHARVAHELARDHGLHACWSQPLFARDGAAIGTIAMHSREPKLPTSTDLQLIEDAATVAVIAVEGERAQAALDNLRTSEDEMRSDSNARRGSARQQKHYLRRNHSDPVNPLYCDELTRLWRGRRIAWQRRSATGSARRAATRAAHHPRLRTRGCMA
ncbi:MAG: GAF domain-containing protein [Gemmatimonadaceae bacterium]